LAKELIPELRILKKNDIPEIIEICKRTWNGHDHLPHMINEWLDNTSCHPFVLEQDTNIVGVANIHVIDNGTTAWMEGLRIHPEYRKKGFGEQLTTYLVDVAKSLKVKRLRLVTNGDNIASLKLAAGAGMKQIAEYAVFWKGFRRNSKWTNNVIPITKMDSESVISFMKNNPTLVPINAIIRHWDIFDATPKKIRDLGKNGTYLGGANEFGAALSFGIEQSNSYGPEWCFSLYATNRKSFLSGLSANLSHSHQNGVRNLMCIHPLDFTSLYSTISWLKRRNYELRLILHELVL
jgi:N-acetylglutamate synthase-like GNAT family acetyltransferase